MKLYPRTVLNQVLIVFRYSKDNLYLMHIMFSHLSNAKVQTRSSLLWNRYQKKNAAYVEENRNTKSWIEIETSTNIYHYLYFMYILRFTYSHQTLIMLYFMLA